MIAIAAPIKGAVEKYALALAVPSPRNARTNSTRLTPYPKKPISKAEFIFDQAGKVSPAANAKLTFTIPDISPLDPAINTESVEEILRVKLLSIAQHKQAAAIDRKPAQLFNPACFGHDNNILPTVIRNMPKTIRRSVCSLKKIHASKAVITDSRFKRSEAVAALV